MMEIFKLGVQAPIAVKLRLINCLLAADIRTFQQFLGLDEEWVYDTPNCGKKMWELIQRYQVKIKDLGVIPEPYKLPVFHIGMTNQLNTVTDITRNAQIRKLLRQAGIFTPVDLVAVYDVVELFTTDDNRLVVKTIEKIRQRLINEA